MVYFEYLPSDWKNKMKAIRMLLASSLLVCAFCTTVTLAGNTPSIIGVQGLGVEKPVDLKLKPPPKPTKCLATRVTPNYGSKGDKFVVYGSKMQGCRIQFTGGGLNQPIYAQNGMGNDTQLEAYVPQYVPFGYVDLSVLPVDEDLISANFRFSVSKAQSCLLSGISPTTAQIGDTLTLSGSSITGCNFYFVNAGGNEFEGRELGSDDPNRTKVVVPLDLGMASSAAVYASKGARTDTSAQPLLLKLAPPAATLGSPTPNSVIPDSYLTVLASNVRGTPHWVGYFDWKAVGKAYHRQAPVTLAGQDATKFTAVFKVQVPDMYLDGMGDSHETLAAPKFFTLFRDDKLASNATIFQLLSPRFLLESCNKTSAYPGDTITCTGSNYQTLFQPYTVWFEYEPGHIVTSAAPTWSGPSVFSVKVPDVYANKAESERKTIQGFTGGKISLASNLNYGFKHSNALPFHIDSRSAATPPTTPASRPEDNFLYCGQATCAGVMGGYPMGKVCCKVEMGAKSPDCGPGHTQYQPDCTNFTSGPGGVSECGFHPDFSPVGCWRPRH